MDLAGKRPDLLEMRGAELEPLLGGKVVNFSSFPGGKSRLLWTFDLLRNGSVEPMVLLRETGYGPNFGTCFEMRREAGTLRGLWAAGMAVPQVHYISPEGDMLVMDRLAGRADFTFDNEAKRLATVDDFVRTLAKLHALDVTKVDLGRQTAADRRSGSLADLADYERSYRGLCTPQDIIEEGLAWLRDHVPDDVGPASVLQGDTGPTNFMHLDTHVTGLIDWEMSHVGDPTDDLAWIWFRSSKLGFDHSITAWLEAYQRHTGLAIDIDVLRYYAVFVVFRCTIACHVRRANDPPYGDERPAQLRTMLAAALADVRGGSSHFLTDLV